MTIRSPARPARAARLAVATKELRPDIQALRACAVLLVLGYHLFPSRLTGGFIGVDVFFVISGYLIVGNLLREVEASGSIRLWGFWSRRAKRLAPASLLVLVASAGATILWVPQNLWTNFFKEVLASTFYVQNWLLASNSVDYLAADNTASPVQHFWTLSVEEQFYIATPLILVVVLAVARARRLRPRTLFFSVVTAIVVGSLLYSIWLTDTNPPYAYFATTTRAWEFGVGALLVFVRRRPTRVVATASAAVGLGGLVACSLLLADGDPFPGWIATLVVLPSALLIWSGPAVTPAITHVVRLRPVQLIGSTSYSIYLWHWPLIILTPYVVGHPLRLSEKAGIVVATMVLGWASTRFVEDPVRYSPRLLGGSRRPAVIMAWSVAGMVLVSSLVGGGFALQAERRSDAAAAADRAVADHPECVGARVLDNPERCDGAIPRNTLIPDPSVAVQDDSNRAECWSTNGEARFRLCSFGPPDASVHLAAVGDSHNNTLIAAYRAIAEREGWRIDVAGHAGCYWTDAVQPLAVESDVTACEEWKDALRAHLNDSPPLDAIIVTHSRTRSVPLARGRLSQRAVAAAGMVDAWRTQTVRGTQILALRDNPAMARDILTCVTRWRAAANRHCSAPRARVLSEADPILDAVARVDGAFLIDLSDTYCSVRRCPPVIGNVVVYRDSDHLTATFVESLVPRLSAQLRAVLDGGPG